MGELLDNFVCFICLLCIHYEDESSKADILRNGLGSRLENLGLNNNLQVTLSSSNVVLMAPVNYYRNQRIHSSYFRTFVFSFEVDIGVDPEPIQQYWLPD